MSLSAQIANTLANPAQDTADAKARLDAVRTRCFAELGQANLDLLALDGDPGVSARYCNALAAAVDSAIAQLDAGESGNRHGPAMALSRVLGGDHRRLMSDVCEAIDLKDAAQAARRLAAGAESLESAQRALAGTNLSLADEQSDAQRARVEAQAPHRDAIVVLNMSSRPRPLPSSKESSPVTSPTKRPPRRPGAVSSAVS